ncbi:hypothetical protein [Nocardia terpenica]|uniref:Uncharacterized protein n=1 Tax=Nocardia terpenica TaxID=455432 RepID=A0A6G9Z060_9NOCA|nr:hypothetical protein [Nocardia terpenica]QIS18747.1 hypothetical protein F6W96_11050 [Nocardia terpenica]
MTDDNTPDDPYEERIAGKIVRRSTTEYSPEEMAKYNAMFDDIEKQRAQIPPGEVRRLPDKMGDQDFEGTEYEEWVNQRRRERDARGEDDR